MNRREQGRRHEANWYALACDEGTSLAFVDQDPEDFLQAHRCDQPKPFEVVDSSRSRLRHAERRKLYLPNLVRRAILLHDLVNPRSWLPHRIEVRHVVLNQVSDLPRLPSGVSYGIGRLLW